MTNSAPTPEAPATQLLSGERIDQIRTRWAQTQPGPWRLATGYLKFDTPIYGEGLRLIATVSYLQDAEPIAEAKQDVPALLAHCDAQQAAFATYQAQVRDTLRGLLQSEDSKIVGMSSFELQPAPEVFAHNSRIRAAAAALGLEL